MEMELLHLRFSTDSKLRTPVLSSSQHALILFVVNWCSLRMCNAVGSVALRMFLPRCVTAFTRLAKPGTECFHCLTHTLSVLAAVAGLAYFKVPNRLPKCNPQPTNG